MYTVVMGAGSDAERALTKARAIVALPGPFEELAVTVVHASDDPQGAKSPVVNSTIEFFEERGVKTTVVTVQADPSTALLDTATEREADLVCVGGRRRSPAGKVQLRRGAQAVILNTDRPVLVAGEPSETRTDS